MLKIIFGETHKAIFNTSIYFNNQYENKWFKDPFTSKIIKNIDKSELLSNNAVLSPVLGVIPITSLSNGSKTLILMKNKPKIIFNASTCGDNCAKYILEIAKEKDITINLLHIMDFGINSFEIYIVNSNKVVTTMYDLLLEAGKYV